MLATGGDDDVVEVGIHALRLHHFADAFPRFGETLGGAVLKRLSRALLGDPRHLRGKARGRKGRGVGQASSKRDHLGPGCDFHQVAHRTRAHDACTRGEQAGVALEVASRGVGATVRRVRAFGRVRAIVNLGHSLSVAQRKLRSVGEPIRRVWRFSSTAGTRSPHSAGKRRKRCPASLRYRLCVA